MQFRSRKPGPVGGLAHSTSTVSHIKCDLLLLLLLLIVHIHLRIALEIVFFYSYQTDENDKSQNTRS